MYISRILYRYALTDINGYIGDDLLNNFLESKINISKIQ